MKRSSLSLTAVAACLSIACLSWSPSSRAADDPFPVRPVTIVNPNAPGGFVDIVARGLAASMQRQLRQPAQHERDHGILAMKYLVIPTMNKSECHLQYLLQHQ